MGQCALTGKKLQFGNNVSHSKRRTRRTFQPNVQRVTFTSEALGCEIALNVSVSALRTVQKKGGIDAYLLKTEDKDLAEEGIRLKRRVLKRLRK